MRIRKLLRERKALESDTGWKTSDLPPRHAPVFPRTTPIRGDWRWRSAQAAGSSGRFFLLAKCNVRHGNWQAILMLKGEEPSWTSCSCPLWAGRSGDGHLKPE